MVLTAASLILAAVLGFAAHRASICTVKAVAEVLTTRRAHIVASFAKTILWILAVTVPMVWLLPAVDGAGQAWPLTAASAAGGYLFGVGAALNGGCAFSTLSKLCDGRLSMLLTLIGFTLGMAGHALLVRSSVIVPPTALPATTYLPGPWSLAALAIVELWVMWEAVRLLRTRPAGRPLGRLVLADRYRLSSAAALLGLSNGVLFALHGTWTYTTAIDSGVDQLLLAGPGPGDLKWTLFAALLGGMLVSSWQRGSFRLDWRPSARWIVHLLAGGLMGLGAALAPGGNEALLLNGIPGLSPHAVPALLTVLAGIATVLVAGRWVGTARLEVRCSGDVCGD